jgi:hypothetical protein
MWKLLRNVIGALIVFAALAYLSAPIWFCVSEGTLIDTPSGAVRVEELRVGDVVLALRPDGGLAPANVVAIQSRVATWWRRLSFGNGRVLEVTTNHPIASAAGWRPAGALEPGDSVVTLDGLVPLQAADLRVGLRTVYDLSVDPYENFIAAGVVVHNKRILNRVRAGEASAIGDSRSVLSSQVAYAASNGGAYGTMACLGAPTRCGFAADTTPFLDSNIASLQVKQGYVRSFIAGSPAGGKPDPGISSFVYVATPVRVGETGNRGFAIDSSGLLCFTTDGSIPPIVKDQLSPDCRPLK